MPEPVPILLLTRGLGHGGGERQLAMTALTLDRTRYLPHIASCESGFWTPLLEQAGIPLHSIGSRSLLSRKGITEMARLRSFIARHGIRLVQTFDYAVNVYAIPVARSVPGVAAVSNLRCHMNLIPPRDRWLNYLSHRISAAVVVNSEAVRDHLVRDYRVDAGKIFVCHNGLDNFVFHPGERKRVSGLEHLNMVVGVTCVLRPEKNLPLLLEAFAAIRERRPGVTLLIVGSGPEEDRLRGLAAQLQLGDSCIFRPSTRDVAPWLKSIDIFVLPSLTEGLSNSIMEAMACGCCVIASRVGGTPELIDDGVTGLLFPSGDRTALCTALESVIDNAEKRSALAHAAERRMQTEFTLQASVDRMQAIYDRILATHRRPR
jgi:glycosyltransferase involved in cell wall biosynthesis